jgi:hypothetical protein
MTLYIFWGSLFLLWGKIVRPPFSTYGPSTKQTAGLYVQSMATECPQRLSAVPVKAKTNNSTTINPIINESIKPLLLGVINTLKP